MLTQLLGPADTVGLWDPIPPPSAPWVIVVAPHPDDEVLGLGMTMRWLQMTGSDITLVACTDGEASHARSKRITSDELRRQRRKEQARALEMLDVTPSIVRLGLPDGDLQRNVEPLAARLTELADSGATIVVPWAHDGHPDHRAAAEAGRLCVERTRASLWQVPIWGKVRRDRGFGGRVSLLQLTAAAIEQKARAAAEFGTQLRAVGPGPFDGPVLTPAELCCMLDGSETVIW